MLRRYLILLVLLFLVFPFKVRAQEAVPFPTTPKVSCPVAGGKIITSSYQADSANGHCGTSYSKNYSCQCTNGRRAKAIDVQTSPDTDVILPTIGDFNATWRLAETLCAGSGTFPSCVDSNGGSGGLLTFVGTDPGKPSDKWYAQFVHMKISTLTVTKGTSYPPGTAIGKTDESAHVHVVVGKNLNVNGDDISGSAVCDNNWLPSDFICDPNMQPPAAAASQKVIIIGDSLVARAENYLKTALPNAAIDGVVGRQWDEGLAILKNQVAGNSTGAVIVFALGTNGAATEAGIDQVMQAAGSSKVILMTIYGTTSAAKTNGENHNPVIKNALSKYSGKIAIADWNAVASVHPEWFAEDPLGVHPNDAGTKAFADLITTTVGSNSISPSGAASGGSSQSNLFCTKVGNPKEPMPAACIQQPSTGKPTFGATGNLTYYCQGDSKWGDPKAACGVGQVGCGPTSVAMIFSFFGESLTPLDVFNSYLNTKPPSLSCGDGSYPGLANSWIGSRGYEIGPSVTSGGQLDAALAKTYIDKGYLILGSSNAFRGQTGSVFGHIFVVQDVDPNTNSFIMRDPENCNYGAGTELTTNNVQPIKSDKIPNWAYAYPIRRVVDTNIPRAGNAGGGNTQ